MTSLQKARTAAGSDQDGVANLAAGTLAAQRPALTAAVADVPTQLQMEETECGAACLVMVLGAFGRAVPLEEMRTAAGVSRDGSNALSLLRAARLYGLEGHGYRASVDELQLLPGPVIVFWRNNHYVVVEGIRRGRFLLNDPASGRRRITAAEFEQHYSGVALTFAPTDAFVRVGGTRRRFLDTLLRPLRGSQGAVTYALVAGLALVIPTLAASFLAGVFVQYVLAEGQHSWLLPVVGGLAAVVAVTLVLTVVQQYVLLRLQVKLALTMSSGFLWHLLCMPVTFFHERYSGTLVSRVDINGQIAQLLSGTAATTLINLVVSVVYAVAMLLVSPLLGGAVIAVALLNAAALRIVARRRTDGNSTVLRQEARLDGLSFSGLSSIESVKARGGESEFFAQWSGAQAEYLDAEQRLGVPSALLGVVPSFLGVLNTMAVISLGAYLVVQGHVSVAGLVTVQVLASNFLAPVASLANILGRVQTAHGQLQQLDDVMNYAVDVETAATQGNLTAAADPAPIRRLDGRVELRDVTFGYNPTQPPLIDGLSLTIDPGGRVALVGSTGCGKSTIGNLVAGLYQPWSGQILLDGVARREVPRPVLTTSVAKVDQNIFLFDGSVLDNLRLWDDTIERSAVERAARDACIHDEVITRAGGYDTAVSEGGRNFSGGQAQRLEIARALAGDPAILVLDEATSALDTQTERLIDNALRRRGVTTLIIAHRLSTIRDCDEILVLDAGKVVQRGTHEQLLAEGGRYAELIEA